MLLNDHSHVKQQLFHVTCCNESRVFCKPPTTIHWIVCALIFPHTHRLFSLNGSASLLHSHKCVWQEVTSRLVVRKLCTLGVALWNHVTLHCAWFDTLSLRISQCLHLPTSCDNSKNLSRTYGNITQNHLYIYIEYCLQKSQKDNRTPVIIFRKSRIFKTFLKIWSFLLKLSLFIKN